MADEQPQQTRVLLLNGQTIILQGDASDSSINEINADLLQQALQEATGNTESVEEPQDEEIQPLSAAETASTNAANNLVAIFQGEQGETHTIQLTVDQAEALGLHIMSDDAEKMVCTPDIPHHLQNVSGTSQMSIGDDGNQLVFTDNSNQHEESKQMFDPCVTTNTNISGMEGSTIHNDTNSSLQQTMGGLSALPEMSSYMSESNNITLIPQFVNGQMTYTVKLNEDSATPLQNQDFSVMESEEESIEHEPILDVKPKLPLLAPTLPVNSLSTSSTTTIASSISNIRVNSIPNVMNTLTPIVPCLSHTSTTNTYSSAPKSLLSNLSTITPSEKTSKPTYVVVPTTNTMSHTSSNSLGEQMHIKGTPLIRTITRVGMSSSQQSLLTNKATTAISRISTSAHTASSNTLTGIPLVNSNINITRTSTASNSLLQAVSTSLSGGMIRVVAGGTTPRIAQAPTSNGPKFTNILTSSGRLVSAPLPVTKKVITVSSSASGASKTTVPTTATSSVPTVVNSESVTNSTVSAVQSTSARLNINSTKPLGSSENPIQLVQHGQTFHSVQALSQEQLRQIATVLQQQHLDSAPRTKNVLYDAETNTRIIYRVVYPEDLDLREPSSPSDKAHGASHHGALASGAGGAGGPRGRGRRGRPPKSAPSVAAAAAVVAPHRPLGRGVGGVGVVPHHADPGGGGPPRVKVAGGGAHAIDMDLDEDRLAAADDAAKGERKKQVARTRSGRLSRPPRHMVKDYKRLHHLDFADADLDDSDGGYSDYQMSDRETDELDSAGISTGTTNLSQNLDPGTHSGGGALDIPVPDGINKTSVPPKATDGGTLLPGVQVSKRKISSHFRCPTCQKVYLGHSRMARHFDMFPDHGGIDQMPNSSSAGPSSPMPLPDSTQGRVLGVLNGIVRHSGGGRRRGKRRGPWAYMTPEARSERRKIKLREALGPCEAKELSEVAGPAVAGVMSLWELLLLRVETVRTEESLMATLCEELRALLERVQAVAGEVLQPVDGGNKILESDTSQKKETSKEDQLELLDETLCNALGLPSGRYQIVDDHLLSRHSQMGQDFDSVKTEPPLKRLKTEANDLDSKPDDRKPSCPEVLSALALESRPAPLAALAPVAAVADSLPASPAAAAQSPALAMQSPSSKPGTPQNAEFNPRERVDLAKEFIIHPHEAADITKEFNVPSTEGNAHDGKSPTVTADPTSMEVADVDHQFLLPPASDMCVDDLPHEPVCSDGDHHESVDDIVNERLKNLTGFGVSVPEPEVPAQHSPAQFPDATAPVTEQEVPVTFDPEMALAAMGEGDPQPGGGGNPGAGLTEFTPEIALAAMGEGESEPEERDCSHFNPPVAQPVFDSIKAMEEDDVTGVSRALAAIGEGNRESPRRDGSHYNSPSVQPVFDNLKALGEDAVSGVDQVLAAMGEGEQEPAHQNGSHFPTPSVEPVFESIKSMEVDDVSGVDRALAAMGEGEDATTEHNRRRFTSAVQPVFGSMKSIENDVSDVDRALAAMGEGEQEPVKEQNGSHFTSTVHPVFDDIKAIQEDDAVEVGLAAMGEGDQGPSEPNRTQYSSNVPPSVFDPIKSMEDEVVTTQSSHPDIALTVESKPVPQASSSPNSSRGDFSDLGLSSLETSQADTSAETKEELVAFTTSMLTNSANSFITSLAEGVTESGNMNKSEGSSDQSVGSFDPEIALAAMGEGEQSAGVSQIHPHHSGSTFDPEIALASMGEGVGSVSGVQGASVTDPAFQLTSMDVSLDESGGELDFDALSAEFSRTARQS